MLCKSLLVIGRSLFQLMPFFQLVHTECKWIFLEENLPWSLHVTHILSQLSEKHGSIAFPLIYSLPTTTEVIAKTPWAPQLSSWQFPEPTMLLRRSSFRTIPEWSVPPERPQLLPSYRFPTSPSAQWGISVKFIDSPTTTRGEFVLPLNALFASSPPLTKGSLSLRTASISGVDTVSEDRRE